MSWFFINIKTITDNSSEIVNNSRKTTGLLPISRINNKNFYSKIDHIVMDKLPESDKCKTLSQILYKKVVESKINQISFVTGKPKVKVTNQLHRANDDFIASKISNFNSSNVPNKYKTESEEAKIYFFEYFKHLREVCSNGNQKEINETIAYFFSDANKYSAYFRGECSVLLQSIYERSVPKGSGLVSSKDIAIDIYKINDPNFDFKKLNNLHLNEKSNFIGPEGSIPRVCEIINAIDVSRENPDVTHYLTLDQSWEQAKEAAGVDDTYKLLGRLPQKDNDLLGVDHINKVYWGRDFKYKFWVNGFTYQVNIDTNYGNVPIEEREIFLLKRKRILIKEFEQKLNDPSINNQQRAFLTQRIVDINENRISPLSNFDSRIMGKSIENAIFSSGNYPDRPTTISSQMFDSINISSQ